jgi:hypothetical protein
MKKLIEKKIFFIMILFSIIINISLYAQNKNIAKMRIAILEFKSEAIPTATANKVTELLRVEMVKTNKYSIIERNRMDAILKEQGFQQTGCTDETCAVKIGKLLSANKMLIGNVMKLEDMFVITSRLVNVETGIIELAEKETAKSEKDLYNAVQNLSKNLTESIEGTSALSENTYTQKKAPSEEIKSQAQVYDEDMASSIQLRSYETSGIQFGGWIEASLFDKWDKDKTLIADSIDTRLWVKSYLWKDSFFYGRVRDTYTGILKDKGYSGLDKNDNLLELDMAYVGASTESKNINIFAGRKFFSVGTGLVLNGRGDGAQIDYYSAAVNISALAMYTGLLSKDSNPYGLSSKDISDGSRRTFAGGVFSRGILNQTVYAFVLAQFDMQKKAEDEKTKYDSQYWGAGAKGFVAENISYYGELVYESGQSYKSDGSKDTVSAYAVNAEMDYYFNTKMNPTAIFQYAMGSGDKDRSGKSPNGNSSGSDSGFIYFGTYTGGYALKPYLMNIHVLRIGGSVAPMAESNNLMLNRMYVILKYSLYIKDKKDASLADGGASGNKSIAGHGLDLAYKWMLYSDLSVFLNGAIFIPGSAYPTGSSNQYFVFGGFNFAF